MERYLPSINNEKVITIIDKGVGKLPIFNITDNIRIRLLQQCINDNYLLITKCGIVSMYKFIEHERERVLKTNTVNFRTIIPKHLTTVMKYGVFDSDDVKYYSSILQNALNRIYGFGNFTPMPNEKVIANFSTSNNLLLKLMVMGDKFIGAKKLTIIEAIARDKIIKINHYISGDFNYVKIITDYARIITIQYNNEYILGSIIDYEFKIPDDSIYIMHKMKVYDDFELAIRDLKCCNIC